MGLTSKKIAIDMGTSMTRIHVPKKGVVVREPTMLAVDDSSNKPTTIAVGRHAEEMLGKTPDNVEVIRPMQSGVIANFDAATTTLSRFIHMATGRFHLSKPIAMITVSATSTSTEKKAMIDAGIDAGLQHVYLIDDAVAAALGAGLNITEPSGTMIVDIGAGTTETGIFSLGGVVASGAVRAGGNDIDDAIKLYARRELGITLSRSELQRVKYSFVNLAAQENNSYQVTGKSIVDGMPKKVTLKQKQLGGYIDLPIDKIVRSIRSVIEKSPPDVVSDIVKHGLVLSGGGAQLKGLASVLTKQLNVACLVTQHPELACIKGAHAALTHLEDYQRSLLA